MSVREALTETKFGIHKLAFRFFLLFIGIRQMSQLVEVSEYKWSICCVPHWAVRSALYYWHSEDWCGVVTRGRFSEIWAFDKELLECWSTRAGQKQDKIVRITRTKAKRNCPSHEEGVCRRIHPLSRIGFCIFPSAVKLQAMHFPTQCIYIFSMSLGMSSDCFPEAYADISL